MCYNVKENKYTIIKHKRNINDKEKNMDEEALKKLLIGIIAVLLLAITFWAIIGKSIKNAPIPNNMYTNDFKDEWNQMFDDTYSK